ncbi:MAG TPA: hypothetical protein VGK99_04115 [Acidobacteriota bacterium]|jgi:hypothetical protein
MKAKTATATVVLLFVFCAALGAQEEKKIERNVVVQRGVMGGAGMASTIPIEGPFGGAAMGDRMMFVSSEMAFENKLVKGVPYQAQATSEHVQVLADGNRISRKDSASVYRDSEGRTRREQNISAIGPWAPAGEHLRMVFIIDPVADVSYILDPDRRTARKVFAGVMLARDKMLEAKLDQLKAQHAGEEIHVELKGGGDPKELEAKIEEHRKQHPGERLRVEIRDGVESVEVLKPEAAHTGRAEVKFNRAVPAPNVRTEQLGRQIFEGVDAEGTRTVLTIPVGEIGNERPIDVVTERWYSPDLQVVVMSRHSDPRLGEDVYRLTNIQRVEPPAALFQVPPDYTIKEGKENFEVFKYKGELKK